MRNVWLDSSKAYLLQSRQLTTIACFSYMHSRSKVPKFGTFCFRKLCWYSYLNKPLSGESALIGISFARWITYFVSGRESYTRDDVRLKFWEVSEMRALILNFQFFVLTFHSPERLFSPSKTKTKPGFMFLIKKSSFIRAMNPARRQTG